VTEKGYFMTWPPRDGMDGFFAARLERRGSLTSSP
jgi:16S rRNA C967 or C1407 C5-methylase (RsmB/RsmF family)